MTMIIFVCLSSLVCEGHIMLSFLWKIHGPFPRPRPHWTFPTSMLKSKMLPRTHSTIVLRNKSQTKHKKNLDAADGSAYPQLDTSMR